MAYRNKSVQTMQTQMTWYTMGIRSVSIVHDIFKAGNLVLPVCA